MRRANESSGSRAEEPVVGLDDSELVRRIRAGDRSAFAGLVLRDEDRLDTQEIWEDHLLRRFESWKRKRGS